MDTFIIFVVLGLFIVLTISLRSIPFDGFGVLEQFGKIHRIYEKPGVHFVIPGVQKMYLYHRETTLDLNQLQIISESGSRYIVTVSISNIIKDIKPYHTLIKNTTIQVDVLKQIEQFIEKGLHHPNTMKDDLSNYLNAFFIQTPDYPFSVTHIDVIHFDLA